MSELVRSLVRETGLGASDIRRIIATAPERYKTYAIKKRNGIDRRIISQPAKELKVLQRALIKIVLSSLPVHEAATAYVRGKSIADNVRPHTSSGPILKFDFTEFFTSIKISDWENYCHKNGIFQDDEDARLSGLILFKREPGRRGLRLSIGAPSSPILSNILMFDIDRRICQEIVDEYVVYTRYADDLTFSAPRTGFLNGVEKQLRRILRETSSPHLMLNPTKTVYATKRYRREVTGIIISNDKTMSVGRDRKRNLMAAVHAALLGRLNKEQVRETLGMISFVQSIERDYEQKVMNKYGDDCLSRLRQMIR